MLSDEEKLLELAFKAEKVEERAQAIRLYREVANGDSEHASYARNCAETLERLGVPAGAKLPDLESPISDSSVSNSDNPYQSPATTQVREVVAENDVETVSRIQITATIIRSISVFSIVAGVYIILWLRQMYGNPLHLDTWIGLHLPAWLDGLTAVTPLSLLLPRLRANSEAMPSPAGFLIDDPIMHSIRAALPEFEFNGRQFITAPVIGQWHRRVF